MFQFVNPYHNVHALLYILQTRKQHTWLEIHSSKEGVSVAPLHKHGNNGNCCKSENTCWNLRIKKEELCTYYDSEQFVKIPTLKSSSKIGGDIIPYFKIYSEDYLNTNNNDGANTSTIILTTVASFYTALELSESFESILRQHQHEF